MRGLSRTWKRSLWLQSYEGRAAADEFGALEAIERGLNCDAGQ